MRLNAAAQGLGFTRQVDVLLGAVLARANGLPHATPGVIDDWAHGPQTSWGSLRMQKSNSHKYVEISIGYRSVIRSHEFYQIANVYQITVVS